MPYRHAAIDILPHSAAVCLCNKLSVSKGPAARPICPSNSLDFHETGNYCLICGEKNGRQKSYSTEPTTEPVLTVFIPSSAMQMQTHQRSGKINRKIRHFGTWHH
jgi:hypothetical protein